MFWSKSGNLLEDFFEVDILKVIVSIFGSFVHVYIIPPICASNIIHFYGSGMNGFAEEKDLILFLASLESFIKSDDAGGRFLHL